MPAHLGTKLRCWCQRQPRVAALLGALLVVSVVVGWEIHQIAGVGTLQQSYGGVPPHWFDGKIPKLLWLPQEG